MSDSVETDNGDPPTQIVPSSLSGITFTKDELDALDREADRSVELELRRRQRLAELEPDILPEEFPEEKPHGQEIIYMERAHWVALLPIMWIFGTSIIFSIGLIVAILWINAAPPVVTTTPKESAGAIENAIVILFNGLIKIVLDTLVLLIGMIEPYLPIVIIGILIAGFIFNIVVGFKSYLQWLYTWRVVTNQFFALKVVLPEKNWLAMRLLTLINIDPDSDPLPRSAILNPRFRQGFFGSWLGFGRVQLESAAQYDRRFRNIRFVRMFDIFRKEMDPMYSVSN